jgi:hypothetical protein
LCDLSIFKYRKCLKTIDDALRIVGHSYCPKSRNLSAKFSVVSTSNSLPCHWWHHQWSQHSPQHVPCPCVEGATPYQWVKNWKVSVETPLLLPPKRCYLQLLWQQVRKRVPFRHR